MKEVQGPTPAGTSRPYRSLTEALRAHRIPAENHAFIAAIVDAIGITALIDRGRYIEAIRRGEGATLHIGRSYTNGFTADERIVVGSAVLRLEPSEGRPPYYYTPHPSAFLGGEAAPVSRTRGADVEPRAARAPRAPRATRTVRASPPAEREYGVCPNCFMMRRASGTCDCD